MKALYLLTTEHLENLLWFREGEDFKVAMNYVAIQAAETPDVAVFAFILMSNHVHFLLKGHRERTTDYVQGFKHRYSLYYSRKYGIKEFLRKNGLDVKLIPYEDEAPEKAVAYIQMNSVAANICAHPSQYSWGTGNTFFNPAPTGGKRLSSLSGRARKRLLHSESDHRLPPDWQICESGYIPPGYYVDVTAVEALFRSPRRMNFFLVNSSKAKKRMESKDEHLPAFRDQTILATLPDLCRSMFQKTGPDELSSEEKAELLRQIRFRFSADANQIARVCNLTYAEAARLLDSV